MAEINDLNVTDASNTARFPENQLPSTVNNGARALEGIIARWHNDINGSVTPGGTADVITVAANQTLSAYYDGLVIAFEVASTNTSTTVTVNVDSLGAKSVKKPDGTDPAVGDLVSGAKVILIYDGTNFQIVSHITDTTQSTLAEDWATKTDGQVASTDYSAKAWATGGTGVTDTASGGAAKEWATAAEDDLVDTVEYSAKHYSAKASTQASNASTSASNASTSETNAATSASNASTSETNAAASAAAAAASAASNLYSSVTNATGTVTPSTSTDDGTLYVCDTSGGAVTVNLPAIGSDEGVRFGFINSSGSNDVTINRNGSDTINGGTSLTLTDDTQFVTLIADDNSPDNWISLAGSTITAGTGLTKTGETISISSGGVDTTQLADNGVTPAKAAGSVNAQTGTTYTLVIGDAFKTITMSNASANTLTIPTNASVAFSTGDRIDIWMKGAGTTTVTGDTGVTLNGVSAGGGAISAQYSAVSIVKIGTDEWLMSGNHAAVA